MSLLRKLDALWYTPAPAARLALLRVLVGTYGLVYLLIRAPSLLSVTRFDAATFEPVGPVRLLSHATSAAVVYASMLVALLAGAAFVLGAAYRLSGPLFAISFLWLTSYRSSWGMVFHTENLPALHLLVLAAAPAAATLSFDARESAEEPPDSGRFGWAIRAVSAITVVTYVLAGVAKLKLAGGAWLHGDLLRAQVAYDNLRKIELGSFYSPLGAWLVRYEGPFALLAWLSLLLELGAPIALCGGRIARLWVVGVFAFHVGVVLLMAIGFPYQLSLVAYASFFSLEALLETRLLRRWRGVKAP